jgi:Domain of unknown function (DUF5615)
VAELHSDECFPLAVVDELRRLGHDVLTAQDAGRSGSGLGDDDVLTFATAHRRAVLTHNVWDFVRLHQQGVPHAGIISCTRDVDSSPLATRIHAAVSLLASLDNQLVRITKPP